MKPWIVAEVLSFPWVFLALRLPLQGCRSACLFWLTLMHSGMVLTWLWHVRGLCSHTKKIIGGILKPEAVLWKVRINRSEPVLGQNGKILATVIHFHLERSFARSSLNFHAKSTVIDLV